MKYPFFFQCCLNFFTIHSGIHTLSVRIPQSISLESVNNKASTLREAILLQASYIVVVAGTVRAFDSLKRLTVRSPPVKPLLQIQHDHIKKIKVKPKITIASMERDQTRTKFYLFLKEPKSRLETNHCKANT